MEKRSTTCGSESVFGGINERDANSVIGIMDCPSIAGAQLNLVSAGTMNCYLKPLAAVRLNAVIRWTRQRLHSYVGLDELASFIDPAN